MKKEKEKEEENKERMKKTCVKYVGTRTGLPVF